MSLFTQEGAQIGDQLAGRSEASTASSSSTPKRKLWRSAPSRSSLLNAPSAHTASSGGEREAGVDESDRRLGEQLSL